MTASSGTPEMIFRASKLGADDFVAKPIDLSSLDQRMTRLLEGQRLTSEVTQLRDQVRRQSDFSMLFGTSPKMEDVKNTIEQVADTNATVLIRGESGTGKEVVARMVFSHSLRHEKPFVKVNCAAIPNELLESELFGYEPGAFTGANRQKLGKFDLAHGGNHISGRDQRNASGVAGETSARFAGRRILAAWGKARHCRRRPRAGGNQQAVGACGRGRPVPRRSVLSP